MFYFWLVSKVWYFSDYKQKNIIKKTFVGTDASKTRFEDEVTIIIIKKKSHRD